jgi:hypothetical protein
MGCVVAAAEDVCIGIGGVLSRMLSRTMTFSPGSVSRLSTRFAGAC